MERIEEEHLGHMLENAYRKGAEDVSRAVAAICAMPSGRIRKPDGDANVKNTAGERGDGAEIEKMCVMSTAHISEKTADALDGGYGPAGLVFYEKEGCGWFIYTTPFEEDEDDPVPDDLLLCLLYARNRGCRWLCLDRDAKKVDGLPDYNW